MSRPVLKENALFSKPAGLCYKQTVLADDPESLFSYINPTGWPSCKKPQRSLRPLRFLHLNVIYYFYGAVTIIFSYRSTRSDCKRTK